MRYVLLFSLVLAYTFYPVTSKAGTFMVGAKYWHANWDSAILDWFEKDIGGGFKALGVELQSDIDTGTGYLAGPIFSYQTDDGSLAISIAPMLFSSFSQDWTGKAGTMDLVTNVDTERKDIDFAIIYSLTEHKDKFSLFKYSKIFLGYKYQTINYDLNLSYNTLMGPQTYDYELDAKIHMPTLGLGLVYPAYDKLAIGLQAGVGLALIDLKMKDPDGNTFDISPSTSISYNTEITATYKPIDNLIIQLGYRYQVWYLKARSPEHWRETESEDITHGPTISVLYLF